MKTEELLGKELDCWVAKACGYEVQKARHTETVLALSPEDGWGHFNPSTAWTECGPLIEKWEIDIIGGKHKWFAVSKAVRYDDMQPMRGPTPQIAICRAVVAAVFGEEVPSSE